MNNIIQQKFYSPWPNSPSSTGEPRGTGGDFLDRPSFERTPSPQPSPPEQVGKEAIENILYSISTKDGQHALTTDLCSEVADEILKLISGAEQAKQEAPGDEKFFCYDNVFAGKIPCDKQCVNCQSATPVLQSIEGKTREILIDMLQWYNGFSQRKDITEEQVDDYLKFRGIPTTLPAKDKEEFLKYVDEARDEFVSFIRNTEWRNDLRTHVDSLLICFDQMKERLTNEAGERK